MYDMKRNRTRLTWVLITLTGIMQCSMVLGLIFYGLRLNYWISVYDEDNITLRDNKTIGQNERHVNLTYTYIIYLGLGLGTHIMACLIFDTFGYSCGVPTISPKILFWIVSNILPAISVGTAWEKYINAEYFTDEYYYNAGWLRSVVPKLNCSVGEIAVDYWRNYTADGCESFGANNYSYTQCCAHIVISPLKYELDILVWEHVRNTTVYASMIFFVIAVDICTTNMRIGCWKNSRVCDCLDN